ncbi:MAG: S16 family serine protease, partial [Verrucomicrobiota bacterium]
AGSGVILQAWLVSMLVGTWSMGQERELPYVAPDFGAPFVSTVDLPGEQAGRLGSLMLDIVSDEEVDGFTRGKAMILAYALGEQEEVMMMDFSLRHQLNRLGDESGSILPSREDPIPMADSPVFRGFDKNGDGLVTSSEAGAGWERFRTHDRNGDGVVSREEVADVTIILRRSSSQSEITHEEKLSFFLDRTTGAEIRPYLEDLKQGIDRGASASAGADWSSVFPHGNRITVGPAGYSSSGAVLFQEPGTANVIDGGADGFKKRQSLIKGLLVVVLDGGNVAGSASQMNATVVPGSSPSHATTVGFNQEVGEYMEGGLNKVFEFIQSHHGDLPSGQRVEISFESQYAPKDGDSASVACALLLDSLIEGAEIDQSFAVTGALEPDGVVGAVGGIDGKIRAAASRKCTHVAIPKENLETLGDMLILDGPAALCGIQIFSIDTFGSAKALSSPAGYRSAELQESLDLFATVQKVVQRSKGTAILRNPQVQERLRKVVQLTPNHVSARFLLLEAIGRTPKNLSLGGSLTAIDRAALPLMQGLRNDDFKSEGSALDSDEFAKAASNLRFLRPKLDQRAQETADTILEFSELFRTWRNNRPRSPQGLYELALKIEDTGDRVQSTYNSLVERINAELEE